MKNSANNIQIEDVPTKSHATSGDDPFLRDSFERKHKDAVSAAADRALARYADVIDRLGK